MTCIQLNLPLNSLYQVVSAPPSACRAVRHAASGPSLPNRCRECQGPAEIPSRLAISPAAQKPSLSSDSENAKDHTSSMMDQIPHTTKPRISLRAPTTSPHHHPPSPETATPSFNPPTPEWLSGTWHVTHSTLPMWKSARNVRITYTILPPPTPSSTSTSTSTSPLPPLPQLDDLVEYQKLSGGERWKKIEGIDTPAPKREGGGGRNGEGEGGEWNWRGKGWLKVASSHWEVLGWGDLDENQWVVTYFGKTLFTPAGVDVYTRRKEGAGEEVLEAIKEAMGRCGNEEIRGFVGELFEVKRD